jgi:hypothetical protein
MNNDLTLSQTQYLAKTVEEVNNIFDVYYRMSINFRIESVLSIISQTLSLPRVFCTFFAQDYESKTFGYRFLCNQEKNDDQCNKLNLICKKCMSTDGFSR